MRELFGRALMLLGLLITGMALFVGLFGGHPFLLAKLGGPVRAELTVLAVGAALFVGLFGGHPFLLAKLGGPVRAELTVLAIGAALFFLGSAVGGVRR